MNNKSELNYILAGIYSLKNDLFARNGFSVRFGSWAKIGFWDRNGVLAEMTVRQRLLFSKITFVKFDVTFWPEMAFWLEMPYFSKN